MAPQTPPGVRTPRDRPGVTLFAACLGLVVVMLDVSVVNVATKALGAEFGSSLSGLEWVINGYTLTFAAFLLTAGALGDRFDLRRIFTVGFALFALTSLACGAAPSLVALVAARVLQGVGAALIVPTSLSLVNGTFPGSAARARAVSLWAAAGGLSLALGPVVGGLLVGSLGWRSIFYVNLPPAVLGILLVRAHARPTGSRNGSRERSLDLPGQLLAVLGLGALTGGIVEANVLGWTSTTVLGLLLAAVLASAAFVAVERRSADPMLPPRLFAGRTFRVIALIGVLFNFSFYGLVFVFSLYFQQLRGYSPIAAGLAFVPMTGAVLAANLGCGPMVRRFGSRTVMTTGAVLAAAGYLALVPAVAGSPYPSMAARFALAGFGMGLIVPAMTNAMLGSVEPGNAGIASGVLNAARQFGGLIGVAVMGLLVGPAAAGRFLPGLRVALLAAGAALLLCAGLSAWGTGRGHGRLVARSPRAERAAARSS